MAEGYAVLPASGRGVTLIELILVIGLVAIISVFALNRMDFHGAFGQRGFHDRLKAGLQFARKAAVAQRRYVCVTTGSGFVEFKFNPAPVESVVTPPGTCSSNLILPAADADCGGINYRVCAPSGVTLTGGDFHFDARGGASAATTFGSTGQPNVTVELETGYVH